MIDAEQREHRQRWLNRAAFQRALDQQLAGDPAAAREVYDDWRPMHQFLKEGPDVGEKCEAESEGGQRFN